MRERDIEKRLIARVSEAGGLIRKIKWIGVTGAPDRIVILPAPVKRSYHRFETLWIELKAPGKPPKERQAIEHALLRKYGQEVFVIDSPVAVDELFDE